MVWISICLWSNEFCSSRQLNYQQINLILGRLGFRLFWDRSISVLPLVLVSGCYSSSVAFLEFQWKAWDIYQFPLTLNPDSPGPDSCWNLFQFFQISSYYLSLGLDFRPMDGDSEVRPHWLPFSWDFCPQFLAFLAASNFILWYFHPVRLQLFTRALSPPLAPACTQQNVCVFVSGWKKSKCGLHSVYSPSFKGHIPPDLYLLLFPWQCLQMVFL